MSTTKNSKKQTLNLLLLKGNLYPADSYDYDLLKTRGVRIYRIPLGSLDLLKRTALAQLEINIQGFETLWDSFVPRFETELSSIGTARTVSKNEFWLKVLNANSLGATQLIERTNRFVQRYCLRLSVDTIHEEKYIKYKLRVVHSEEINNSYAFANENILGPSTEVNLTDCLKLVVSLRTLDGSPAMTLQVMDKHGDDWRDNLNRTVRVSGIQKEKLAELASFFLNMT